MPDISYIAVLRIPCCFPKMFRSFDQKSQKSMTELVHDTQGMNQAAGRQLGSWDVPVTADM